MERPSGLPVTLREVKEDTKKSIIAPKPISVKRLNNIRKPFFVQVSGRDSRWKLVGLSLHVRLDERYTSKTGGGVTPVVGSSTGEADYERPCLFRAFFGPSRKRPRRSRVTGIFYRNRRNFRSDRSAGGERNKADYDSTTSPSSVTDGVGRADGSCSSNRGERRGGQLSSVTLR